MKWNPYASATGQYEIVGCEGAAPQLVLKAGETYTFLQTDSSNWYHPVGFAFEAGGALNSCGDEEECPEVEEGLQYYVDGVAKTEDESGFGLDAYEPLFFYPEESWADECGEGGCYAELTVPSNSTKIYYFCHIHKGMSAEIVIDGASPDAKDPEYPELFVKVQPRSDFDRVCGTWDSEPFSQEHPTCKGKTFLCGETDTTFAECFEAIDCQMHNNMAVEMVDNKIANFVRQMIPHHENAVAMSKVLMSKMDLDKDASGNQDVFDEFTLLARSIINEQNSQIVAMRAWLEGYEAAKKEETELCYPTPCNTDADCPKGEKCDCIQSRRLLFSSTPTQCFCSAAVY